MARDPRSVHPLELLAGNSLAADDFAAAQNYSLRALELSEKDISENNPTVCDALRMVSTVYIIQQAYDKARPYLVRAVDLGEKLYGSHDYRTIGPLYALCDVESHLDDPKDTEQCYQRLVAVWNRSTGKTIPQSCPLWMAMQSH
jgi:hypothetical protein